MSFRTMKADSLRLWFRDRRCRGPPIPTSARPRPGRWRRSCAPQTRHPWRFRRRHPQWIRQWIGQWIRVKGRLHLYQLWRCLAGRPGPVGPGVGAWGQDHHIRGERIAPMGRIRYSTTMPMSGDSPDIIRARFDANIARVRAFVTRYETAATPGRAAVEDADLLRAAVVLLHAALEDLLRSVEETRLPVADPAALKSIRFAPLGGGIDDRKEKFTLEDLASWRGRTVDDVIWKAIELHLERSNYNNFLEVKQALARSGLSAALKVHDGAILAAMMSRRHWIAHRADRNRNSGRGHFVATSISKASVNAWISLVESLGARVVKLLGAQP